MKRKPDTRLKVLSSSYSALGSVSPPGRDCFKCGSRRAAEVVRARTTAMSGATGERTRPVLTLLWVTAAASLAGSEMVKTTSEMLTSCGNNVTLPCVAFLEASNISLFAWVDGKKHLCQHSSGQTDPEVLCEHTAGPSHHNLSLTLFNVMPVNELKYTCKFRSDRGINSSNTRLTVRSCLKSYNSSTNSSHVQCRFTGVYPRGTVHWLHDHDNLTDDAVTQEEVDQQGRFTITSSVAMEMRNYSQPFNCLLWIPAEEKYTLSLMVKSAGAVDKLHWICFLVVMMMLTSVA